MTQDETERLAQLAERLAAATAVGDAKWQARELELYVWSSDHGSVTIASRDRDGEPPYELAIYNSGDDKVDQLVSELLPGDEPAPWNDSLAELHRVARRSALRADEIIDALMGALPPVDSSEGQSFLRRAREHLAPIADDRLER